MDTEVKITQDNCLDEVEMLWQAVCAFFGMDPDLIPRPRYSWVGDQILEMGEMRIAGLGRDRKTIYLSNETDVYRGHIAHEIAHYIRWQIARDESEHYPVEVDKELYRL
jgi:hypothetical protein